MNFAVSPVWLDSSIFSVQYASIVDFFDIRLRHPGLHSHPCTAGTPL